MHVACVLIDHFPFKLEAARDPILKRHRAIIFKRSGSQYTVVDASPVIKRVVAGMHLREAQSICKDSMLIEADIPRYERDFSRVLLRLAAWSPVVEAAGLGRVYVGLDGLERTHGGEAQLIDGLLQAVPGHLEPRLGVSYGKFPAYLAATNAQPGRACRPPGGLKDFLAPFSVDVLPVSWEVKTRLHSFGLHTLAQIASLPLGPVQAQFGPTGATIWRLSRGMDDTLLLPTRPEAGVKESIPFPVPMANLEPLLLADDGLGGESPVRFLDARFIIALSKDRAGRLRRRQDLPAAAFVDLAALRRMPEGRNGLRVTCVSYPWLQPECARAARSEARRPRHPPEAPRARLSALAAAIPTRRARR